jgi:hypothetical protein
MLNHANDRQSRWQQTCDEKCEAQLRCDVASVNPGVHKPTRGESYTYSFA